ncbi:MAG: hypothetical protein QNJ14_00455 [Woeseiaceae bacterium]|nr:hypothetical protein [Woeseiaceae bacterium]
MDTESAHAIMSRVLETNEFNEISRWLRNLDGGSRIEFLICWCDNRAIWRLATSTINKRDEAREFLVHMLNRIDLADSQKTKHCVEFGVAKIGARRVIAEIASRIDSQPHVVDMAVYHLKGILRNDGSGREELDNLTKAAQDKGILRPAVSETRPDGTVVFKDRYGD